jgi:hypothetical protein
MTFKGLEGLRNVVAGVFVGALLLGVFLPVYTDEIGWRFQERAAIDGVDKLYSDICGPNTLAAPPAFMMPVRYYSALFNTAFASPLTIRLSGIVYALLWTGLLLLLIRRIAGQAWHRSLVAVCGLGLMSLGTLPLLLVWSRPEQPILIAVLAALLIAWSDWRNPDADTPPRAAWLRTGGVVLLAVVALSYHLKGAFLFPVFAACLWFASSGRAAVLPRLVGGGLLALLTAWALHYWTDRMQCPGDAVFWAKFSKNSIGAALAGVHSASQVPPLLGRLIGNVDFADYFRLPAPRRVPLSLWLEAGQVTQMQSSVWANGLIAVWSAACLAGVGCLSLTARRMWRERKLDRRWAMAMALIVTATGWAATQLIKNVYEASFMLPLLMLAVVLALATQDNAVLGKPVRTRAFRGLAAAIGIAAVLSPLAIGAIYGPSLARAAAAPGYVARQRVSLSVRPYPGLARDVLAAAKLCRIPEPERANSLMIDDLTYLPFQTSRLPQHWLGVVGIWNGEIQDPIAYLESRHSDGIIVGCHILPAGLRARARQSGAFCCLAPPNW